MSKAEEQIRRALEEGQFDDLPGKGKPLNLADNPYEHPDWRLAFHMIRSSGAVLPWMETGREIEASLEAARADLRRAWAWRVQASESSQGDPWVEETWRRAQAAFRLRVVEINARIKDYNLNVPALAFQRARVDAGREIDALAAPGTPPE